MKFDYSDDINDHYNTLAVRIRRIRHLNEDAGASHILDVIESEIDDMVDKIIRTVNDSIADDVCDRVIDLNNQEDSYLMDAIKCDESAYHQIINPSDDVINMYKFLYEL